MGIHHAPFTHAALFRNRRLHDTAQADQRSRVVDLTEVAHAVLEHGRFEGVEQEDWSAEERLGKTLRRQVGQRYLGALEDGHRLLAPGV